MLCAERLQTSLWFCLLRWGRCVTKGENLKKENYSRKINGDKTQFLKDHMGTKSYGKYLIVLAILTKRKTKIILNSFYKITCSILRPNDHRCIERSISVLFVCHTIDVSEDQAQQCGLGIQLQFCRKFHITVAVCYTRFLTQKNLKLLIVTFNDNKLLLKRFSSIILFYWLSGCNIVLFPLFPLPCIKVVSVASHPWGKGSTQDL